MELGRRLFILDEHQHGFAMSIQETVGATHSVETSTGSGEDRTSGFVLADEGTDDYLSVDVYRTNAVGDSTFYNKFYNDSTRTKIKNMFLIQSSSNQTLNVAGTALQGTSNLTLDIAKGWNYISYLPSSSLSVKEAMAGYSVKAGDLIKSQDAFSMYGEKTGWLGNLNYMQPGKGYMLYSSDGGKLVYPDLTAAGTKAITRADGVSDENVWKELRNETNMKIASAG